MNERVKEQTNWKDKEKHRSLIEKRKHFQYVLVESETQAFSENYQLSLEAGIFMIGISLNTAQKCRMSFSLLTIFPNFSIFNEYV